MALQNDNFNDNSIDTSFWAAYEVGSGSVAETNQQLECTTSTSATYYESGLVTTNSHDLTTCDLQVDVNNDSGSEQGIYICLTKVTSSRSDNEDDFYKIMKYNASNYYYVQRKVEGGSKTTLASGGWTGASGSLRIVISGGTITFYEEDNERHSESYALGSYTAYVYLYVRGNNNAMDVFDNFLGSSGAAAFYAAWYYQKLLAGGLG